MYKSTTRSSILIKTSETLFGASGSIFRKSYVSYTLTSIMFSPDELSSKVWFRIAMIGVSVRASSTNHTHIAI